MITNSNCSMLILFLSKSTVFANKLEWYHDNNILNTCPWLGQSWSIPGQKYFPLSPFASPSPYRQPPSRVWLKFLSTKQHTLYNVCTCIWLSWTLYGWKATVRLSVLEQLFVWWKRDFKSWSPCNSSFNPVPTRRCLPDDVFLNLVVSNRPVKRLLPYLYKRVS